MEESTENWFEEHKEKVKREVEAYRNPAKSSTLRRGNEPTEKEKELPYTILNNSIDRNSPFDGELTNETGQVLGQDRDEFGEEKLSYGEMSDAYDKFMSENPEPHDKREVRQELRELLGDKYSDDSFRKAYQRAREKGTTRVRYGGKIQFVNTDWKASKVTFSDNETLPSLGLKLPFSMEFYVDILKKSTMTVEGEVGSGKTHYALDVANLNLGILPIRFFFAELGSERMKDLLRDYPDLLAAAKRDDGSFTLVNTDINNLDVLASLDPNGININDYLRMEAGDQWWLNMQLKLREYATKLEDGFLMVNLQKLKDRPIAMGGEGNRFQCETAVTLNTREVVQGSGDDYGFKLCRLDIVKARDWAGKINPESMSVDYRTGGLRGKLVMKEQSWGLTSEKHKRDKKDKEGKL